MMKTRTLLLLLIAQVTFTLTSWGGDFASNNLKYTTNSDGSTVTVTGYELKPTGDLIIPSTVSDAIGVNYTVTAIANGGSTSGVFYNCTGLTSVTFPETLISTGEWSFNGCSGLRTVTFDGDSQLKTISKYTFLGCSSLSSIELPTGVETLDTQAFYNCTSLTYIEIPNSVKNVGTYLFSGCTSLEIVKVSWTGYPPSSTSMFSDCPKVILLIADGKKNYYTLSYQVWKDFKIITDNDIQDVSCVIDGVKYAIDYDTQSAIAYGYNPDELSAELVIPETVKGLPVTTIQDYSFDKCKTLTSIEIPSGVTSINPYVFSECSNLKTVTFADNSQLETIERYAFNQCDALTSIEFPEGLTYIKNNAFYYCNSLKTVDIPSTVTSIGDYAFYYCSDLEFLIFADNSQLKTIGSYAFQFCKSLTSVEIPEGVTTIASGVFGSTSLSSIVFPEGLTSIGYGAFRSTKITSIEIPSGVTSIGSKAFYYCDDLVSVTVNGSAALIKSDSFYSIGSSAILYVPYGYVDEYSSWEPYFDGGIRVIETELVAKTGETIALDGKTTVYRIIIEEGGEIKAEGNDNITFEELIIEREFAYEDGKKSSQQWFSLALPFAGVANESYVQKFNEDTQAYEPAVCGEDYATFNYNSKNRADNGTSATGANWDMLDTEGSALGELIQFAETGVHKYRFISPNVDVARAALSEGRIGSTYFDISKGVTDDNGWNVVPAGKTYSTADYDIYNGLVSIQLYNNVTGNFDTQVISEMDELKPNTVFAVKLEDEYLATNSTLGNASHAATEVQHYTFELIDENGSMLDRIYLFDGSNQSKYRLGKMSALNAKAAQIAINIDGESYCTYSTLASEQKKSYTVTLANTDGATLVMKSSGSEDVTVDGKKVTVDSPIEVVDGEIVIVLGSATTDVESVNSAISVTTNYGAITISGAEAATAYTITTIGGVTTYGSTTGATTKIEKPAGVYIVKINNIATKVIVK